MLSWNKLRAHLALAGATVLGAAGFYTGCGGGEQLPSGDGTPTIVGMGTGGSGPTSCEDLDGDGYGRACALGADCDDNDSAVTDDCYRCNTPNDGCPCDQEGEVVECGSVSSRQGDRVTCVIGDRVCTGGEWSSCRPKTMKTMSAPLAVAAAPSPCPANPCDPFCQHFDNTTPPDTDTNTTVDMTGVTLVPMTGGGGTGGGAMGCAMTPQTATRDPLGMYMLVDKSGSMGGTPWTNVSNALQTFIQDPGLDSMTAGLDFFPSNSDICNANQYFGGNMSVPLGVLPGVAPAFVSSITSTTPGGSTPMLAAVNGALAEMQIWKAANPDRKAVVVLVTDGLPSDCGNCGGKKGKSAKQQTACAVREVGSLLENYFFAADSVETFIIGVDTGTNLDFLNILARAGSGGRRDATIINGSSGGAQAALVAALNAIRDESLTCDFDIPVPAMGVIDPSTATVTLTSGGVPTNVPQVTSLGACGAGDGFFYDSTGPKMELCPTTCTTAKADLSASIEIVYDCLPACASGSQQGDPGPIDMFVMMDRSGSMGNEIQGVPLWQGASVALRNFIRSPESVGMGFGISYFPPPDTCGQCQVCTGTVFGFCTGWAEVPWPACDRFSGRSCTLANGSSDLQFIYHRGENATCTSSDFVNFGLTQGVDYDILPGAADAHVNAVFASLDKVVPEGGTPTQPALQGAIDHALARAPTVPDRRQIVTLVTDGQPTTCGSTAANTAATAGNGFINGVPTFVIGITGDPSTVTTMDQIALAGSGNQFSAFIIDSGNPTGFNDALLAIQASALNCSFGVPTPPAGGMLDINTAQVLLTTGSPAMEVTLNRVNDSTLCGAGLNWYYDDNVNPTSIELCPTSCTTAQNDVNSRVDIVYQCVTSTTFNQGVATFEYDASSACASDQQPIWGDWSWISNTPTDTKIEFFVATGQRDDISGVITNLSAEVPLVFTNGSAIDGSALCASLPSVCDPGITVDTQQGGTLAFQPGDSFVDEVLRRAGLPRNFDYLRIRAVLSPSTAMSEAPILQNWDLQMSCEDSE